uniref:Uncharacterized protein n=1 Tax=Anguilla anguilla TaxID=7936 RepID=A0A0E9QUM4_ANGAN
MIWMIVCHSPPPVAPTAVPSGPGQ